MNRARIACCCVLVAALAACAAGPAAPAPRNGGTLVVALPSMPATLNPLVSRDAVSERAYAPLFPLLYVAEPDLSVAPELAAGSPLFSDGGRSITVALRGDAQWSDGHPITAADVVYTVDMEMSPALRANFSWNPLLAVAAPDEHTVRFTLAVPDAGFIADRLVTPIVPEHALSGVKPAAMAAAPFSSAPTVTAGPFQFAHRDADSITYDANPAFVLGRPHADHLTVRVVGEANTLPSLLGEGRISFDPDLPPAAAAQGVVSSGVTVQSYADMSVTAVVFNLRTGHAFSELPLRRAFADSIDHDALVARATQTANAIAVWDDVNPSSWAYTASAVRTYVSNVPEARTLLAGTHPAGTLVFPADDGLLRNAAALLVQQANAAGFALTAAAASASAYTRALAQGSFDAALVDIPTALDPDDAALFTPGSSLDSGGYDDPTLLAMIAQDLATTAPSLSQLQQARKPILARTEALVTADLPMYFLWAPRHDVGYSAGLGGVTGAGVQLDADRDNTFYLNWFLLG